jgi:hypothetical protein
VTAADRAALEYWLAWNQTIGAGGDRPCTWPTCPVHGWEGR